MTRGLARSGLKELCDEVRRRIGDSDAHAERVEVRLARRARRPVAVNGIVENALVRPLDPTVKLREHARVVIVEGASS